MFGMFGKNRIFLIFILLIWGCSASSGVNGGFEPDETLYLDEEFSTSFSIGKGEVFALDVVVPTEKGVKLVGASFDPVMMRLDHYLEYAEDGVSRVRYIFTALAVGVSDILIKMEPDSGGDPQVYRMVSANVEDDEGFF